MTPGGANLAFSGEQEAALPSSLKVIAPLTGEYTPASSLHLDLLQASAAPGPACPAGTPGPPLPGRGALDKLP